VSERGHCSSSRDRPDRPVNPRRSRTVPGRIALEQLAYCPCTTVRWPSSLVERPRRSCEETAKRSTASRSSGSVMGLARPRPASACFRPASERIAASVRRAASKWIIVGWVDASTCSPPAGRTPRFSVPPPGDQLLGLRAKTDFPDAASPTLTLCPRPAISLDRETLHLPLHVILHVAAPLNPMLCAPD